MRNRILSLDVGDKKIGVAVSDPFGMTAQPVTTILRKQFKKDCETIFQLIQEWSVAKIVVGLPLDLNCQEGPQAKKVRFFFDGLKKILEEKKCPVAMELFDESFSSQEAEAVLLEADMGRKKRKRVIDKLAAILILQNYLAQR